MECFPAFLEYQLSARKILYRYDRVVRTHLFARGQYAALRYQPTTLSEEQISDMVFNASLVNMNDEQRQAAIEARAVRAAQSVSTQRPNTGFTDLMMGPQPAVRGGGTRQVTGSTQGGRQQGTGQGRGAPRIVMRNLWFINDDGRLEVIQVRTGISDGSSTEIFLSEEFEGRQVILRERI